MGVGMVPMQSRFVAQNALTHTSTPMAASRKLANVPFEGPLTDEQREAGRRVADRLVSEIREVIRSLPLEVRGLVELSERLKVDRNLIQRLLGACKQKDPIGIESLVAVPGPRGLLQFLAALRGAGMGDHEFDGLAAATKLFAEFLQDVGSQASLSRRLNEKSPPGTTESSQGPEEITVTSPPEHEERMFNDAARVTGCSVDALVTISIIRKVSNEPFVTEDIFCESHLGYSGSPKSLPLSFHTYTLGSDGITRWGMADVDGNQPFGLTDNSVLHEFSSKPLPTIVAVPTQAGHGIMHIVDSAEWRQGAKHDLVTLNRIRSTIGPERGVKGYAIPEREISSQVSYPARHLLHDVYVDRSLFRSFTTPEAGCHVWDTDLETRYRQRWLSMLPIRVPLEVLPPRIDQAANEIYPRHPELTATVFELAGLDRAQFVGFRISVRHPIWRAWYRIRFDFLGE